MRNVSFVLATCVVSTMLFAIQPPVATAEVVSSTAQGGGGGENGFACRRESGRQLCSCSGLQDCVDMVASGICKGLASSVDAVDDIDCPKDADGEPLGFCTCTQRSFDDADADPRPEAAAPPVAAEIRDRREPPRGEAGGGIGAVEDGTQNTLVTGTRDHRGTERDHRAVERDHRSAERDHRSGAPGAERTAADEKSGVTPAGLLPPSGLAASDIAGSTLTLSWHDNSTRELGVAVERMDPVAARRDPAAGWRRIGNFEERVQTRVDGTGRRTDADSGLVPGTRYCYRMRAYSGFSMSEVSEYSEVLCVQTGTAGDDTGSAPPEPEGKR